MKYRLTYMYGERDNEATIEVNHVKKIAHDNGTLIMFGEDNEPLLIIRHDKYYIHRL